jgi:Protein of unknown function (DUF2927)
MRRGTGVLAFLACLAALGTQAEEPQFDGVIAAGPLSDEDLYRLATCGSPPGEACRDIPLRWKKDVLTLAIVEGGDPLPPGFSDRLTAAAAHAVEEINAAGAGIGIRPIVEGPADITIRPTAIPEGTVLAETPGFSGSGIMGVGFATVWSQDDTITEAVILISTGITTSDLTSVMLEELTQTLGFPYDIEGPAYEGVSILSQTSNATTTIAGQDAALLRLHYPPD